MIKQSRLLLIRATVLAASIGLLSAYFFQSSTLGPNHTDEGLLLQYIDDMAHGMRPFYDFVDAYGILNWIFPVLFYRALGDEVWGVRIWMIILKVITVLVAYVLVRGLCTEPRTLGAATAEAETDTEHAGRGTPLRGGRFYATIAALLTAVLLGAQWHSLQTPYAFLTVIPLVLGTWHFLLSRPLRSGTLNVLVAAALTSAAIWTKLNTGMYLLAGGLFAYFFWIPVRGVGKLSNAETNKSEIAWTSRARWLGVLSYAVLFTAYTRRYHNQWFFLYLTLPLLLSLGWTAQVKLGSDRTENPRHHTVPFALYFSLTAVLSLTVLFGYYGRHVGDYVHELAGILSSIKYTAPFPDIGKPGYYIGFNEYYWLELPLGVTALFTVWAIISKREGPNAFGASWPERRDQLSALFVLLTLHAFVIYARADETHIYQDLVLAVPAFVAIFAQFDAFLAARRPSPNARGILRFAVAGFTPFYLLSILVLPTRDTFDISRSDWHSRKLEHLRYWRVHSPYVKDFSADISDHDWDIIEDDAALYVKSISFPGEEVLLLTANRLLHLNSETRPVGGRYHFYFYLVSVGLLDRQGFDRLVPERVLAGILASPPQVIVAGLGNVPLAEAFPELKSLRDTRYRRTRSFRHIWIYERNW